MLSPLPQDHSTICGVAAPGHRDSNHFYERGVERSKVVTPLGALLPGKAAEQDYLPQTLSIAFIRRLLSVVT